MSCMHVVVVVVVCTVHASANPQEHEHRAHELEEALGKEQTERRVERETTKLREVEWQAAAAGAVRSW